MPRVFLNDSLETGKEIKITDKTHHYLINVMRCAAGDDVFLVNGKHGEFISKITFANNKYCLLKILDKIKDYKAQPFLGLIFAPIQKLDILVKSAVELGATEFLPIKTSYTNRANIKLDKIQGNIIEAIEQCERLDLPNVAKINDLERVLQSLDTNNSVVFFCEERTGENDILGLLKEQPQSFHNKEIYALVGPEGGFSSDEKKLIKSFKNVVSVSLGDNILRTETAAVSILSIIKVLF